MIKLTKQMIYNQKILPMMKTLQNTPTTENANIALIMLYHYLGKPAITIENKYSIYNRDYFTLAFVKELKHVTDNTLRKIYSINLYNIRHDGMSEYFLLGRDKYVRQVTASDALNVMTDLLNK